MRTVGIATDGRASDSREPPSCTEADRVTPGTPSGTPWPFVRAPAGTPLSTSNCSSPHDKAERAFNEVVGSCTLGFDPLRLGPVVMGRGSTCSGSRSGGRYGPSIFGRPSASNRRRTSGSNSPSIPASLAAARPFALYGTTRRSAGWLSPPRGSTSVAVGRGRSATGNPDSRDPGGPLRNPCLSRCHAGTPSSATVHSNIRQTE